MELNINISKANGTNVHTAYKKNTQRIQQRQQQQKQQQQANVSVKESERRRWMYISKVRLRRVLQIERRKKAATTHTHLPITTAKRNEWEKRKMIHAHNQN